MLYIIPRLQLISLKLVQQKYIRKLEDTKRELEYEGQLLGDTVEKFLTENNGLRFQLSASEKRSKDLGQQLNRSKDDRLRLEKELYWAKSEHQKKLQENRGALETLKQRLDGLTTTQSSPPDPQNHTHTRTLEDALSTLDEKEKEIIQLQHMGNSLQERVTCLDLERTALMNEALELRAQNMQLHKERKDLLEHVAELNRLLEEVNTDRASCRQSS
jgi:chromosome segregation ATPase